MDTSSILGVPVASPDGKKSRLYDFNIQQQRLGGRELLTFLSNVSFTRKGKSPVLEAVVRQNSGRT